MAGVAEVTSPLAGRRVAVLRAEAQGAELAARLRALGAEPVPCPVIAVAPPPSYAPLDAALAGADEYDWIVFTSTNAVDAVAARLAARDLPVPRARLAAIGPATGAALRARLREAELTSPAHHSEGLARALAPARGARILLPVGDLAGPGLAAALAKHADVTVVTAYRTIPARAGIDAAADALRAGGLDALLFTSGSTVRFLVNGLAPERTALLAAAGRPAIVCIGPATAAVAAEAGLTVDAIATAHTTEGVIDALVQRFASGS